MASIPGNTKKAASLCMSLLIAACGGSGGDSSAVSSAPTVPSATGTSTGSGSTTTSNDTPATATGSADAGSATGSNSSGGTSTGNTSPGSTPPSGGTTTTQPPPVSSGAPSASGTPAGGGSGSGTSGSGSTASGGDTGASSGTFKLDENARFGDPSDLALDSAGNLYVMDRGQLAIRRVAATGEVTTVSGGWNAGSRMTIDAAGNLFVLSGTDIWKASSSGAGKAVYASYPQSPGSYRPMQISIDSAGRLYILQQYRNIFRVDRLDTDGAVHVQPYTYTEWGSTFDMATNSLGDLAVGRIGPTGTGSVNLIPQSAQPADANSASVTTRTIALNSFGKLLLDDAGNLYIADMTTSVGSDNKTYATGMRVLKLAPDGTTTTLLSGFPSGQGAARPLPTAYQTNIGLAVSKAGEVFVSVPTDQAVYKITSPGQAVLYAGKPVQ